MARTFENGSKVRVKQGFRDAGKVGIAVIPTRSWQGWDWMLCTGDEENCSHLAHFPEEQLELVEPLTAEGHPDNGLSAQENDLFLEAVEAANQGLYKKSEILFQAVQLLREARRGVFS